MGYSPINIFSNEAQSWHFDRDASEVDSRKAHAEQCLTDSIEIFKNAKNENQRTAALELLGKGLHALQDIDAHMNWGDGNYINTIKKEHVDSQGGKTFDNPQYNMEYKDGQFISSDSGSWLGSKRYLDTVIATYKYLSDWMNGVYGGNRCEK